jgi:two-component system response regulator YesN
MFQALIIDDEKPVRIAISKLGKWTKFHVKQPIPQVENGQDGMKAMWELRPDLVFVDMQMPVMDGVEFLRQASAAFPDSAFIVISGYDNFDYLQNAIRCGASDYLLKPVVEEDLNKAVLEALRKLHPDTDFDDSAADLPEIGAEEVIDIIKNTIDSRYSQNIRIQDFCDKYFFSREYLSKLFKARYQSGIYEYLLSVRMERAKELLADPEIQIQDIASRVGYADNNYFSKAFRNYYGIAPTEYRRNPV